MASASSAEVAELDICCEMFYSPNANEQRRAHEKLLPFTTDGKWAPLMFSVFKQSQRPHTLLFIANALTQVMTTRWSQIDDSLKDEITRYLLQLLYVKGAEWLTTSRVTVNAFIDLLVRVVKLRWLEGVQHQKLCENVQHFLKSSTSTWVVGVSIYASLTKDMQPQLNYHFSKMRRIAFSFRDTALPNIFSTALDTLGQFGAGSLSNAEDELRLLKMVLQLAHNCLTFDFGGTLPDETSDERPDPVLIPSSWSNIRSVKMPSLFFKVLLLSCKEKRYDCAEICLQCLILLASLRRGFFHREQERLAHYAELINCTSTILTDQSLGLLNDQSCYHEFCRLIGRVLPASSLPDLRVALMDRSSMPVWADLKHLATVSSVISTPGGTAMDNSTGSMANLPWSKTRDNTLVTWLELIFSFCSGALREWYKQPNSKHYLLGFWCQLVSPLLYGRQGYPQFLEGLLHSTFESFVHSRIQLAEVIGLMQFANAGYQLPDASFLKMDQILLEDESILDNCLELEDPLDNEVLRNEQLEVVATLSQIKRYDCGVVLLKLLHQTTQLSQFPVVPKSLIERRLIWCVYLIGSYVEASPTKSLFLNINENLVAATDTSMNGEGSAETPPDLTEELCAEVIKLTLTADVANSFSAVNKESMELATLHFLECLRRIHLGDQAKYYAKGVKESSGDEVISQMVSKFIRNLKSPYDSVVSQSLKVFREMSSTVMVVTTDSDSHFIASGRFITMSRVSKELFDNPSACRDVVNMLDPIKQGKYRTALYCILTKLYFMKATIPEASATEHIDSALAPVFHRAGTDPSPQTPDFQTFSQLLQPMAATINSLWPAAATVAPFNLASSPPLTQGTVITGGTDMLQTGQPENPLNQRRDSVEQQMELAALMRDLRGICQACGTVETYTMFFNWLVNKPKTPHLSRIQMIYFALDTYQYLYPVVIPTLKLVCELVGNRSQRISFEANSLSGLILFRHVSKIVSLFAPRALARPDSACSDLFRDKYKSMACVLDLFATSLSGNFSTFAACEVYGDFNIAETLRFGIQMCLAIPNDDLQAYLKTLKSYYVFLELVSKFFIGKVLEFLDFDSFERLLRSLEEGLLSFNLSVALQSCNTVQHICRHFVSRISYVQHRSTSGLPAPASEEEVIQWNSEGQRVLQLLASKPGCLNRLFQITFQLVISGESASIWALAGAVYGLWLLVPGEMENVKNEMVNQQLKNERHEKVEGLFKELMEGMQPEWTLTNKEAFTRNLYQFSQKIRLHI